MSNIWNLLLDTKDAIIDTLDQNCKRYTEEKLTRFHRPDQGWLNLTWLNQNISRAHLDVVDARDQKGIWMMHLCIFPALDNNSPIYGLDIVAGSKKMTGAFHDFSITTGTKDHPLSKFYEARAKKFIPSKERELPEWAKNIFSDYMIAAGNVQDINEAKEIITLSLENLQYYIQNIHYHNNTIPVEQNKKAFNWYAENQRKNVHTPRVMKSLGLNDEDVDEFCSDVLFPTY